MEIRWLSSALDDFAYIVQRVEELYGRSVAERVEEKLYTHIALLAVFPRIGVCEQEISNSYREIRYLVNTPNVIYYIVSNDEIVILAVLDSRQSPERIKETIVKLLSNR